MSTNNNKKPWKHSQSLADSGDKTSSFCRFMRPHLKKKSIYIFFLLIFTLNSPDIWHVTHIMWQVLGDSHSSAPWFVWFGRDSFGKKNSQTISHVIYIYYKGACKTAPAVICLLISLAFFLNGLILNYWYFIGEFL